MKCPRDSNSLVSERYEGEVVVDRCPACRGSWLDRGELATVQNTLERDYSQELGKVDVVARAYELARQKARPVASCPKCQGEMHAEEYAYCSQILIDRCTECLGIWLDGGELQALEKFFERESGARQSMRVGFFGSLLR